MPVVSAPAEDKVPYAHLGNECIPIWNAMLTLMHDMLQSVSGRNCQGGTIFYLPVKTRPVDHRHVGASRHARWDVEKFSFVAEDAPNGPCVETGGHHIGTGGGGGGGGTHAKE